MVDTKDFSTILSGLLNDFPAIGAREIRFGELGDKSGVGIYPSAAATVISETTDIMGGVYQKCNYAFQVVYRQRQMCIRDSNTTAGQTIARKLLMAFLNTGTSSAPVWSIIGKRVEDSSQEYDWNKETTQDILGNTFTTMSAPTITQTFDPCNLDAGETALTKLWQMAIKDQDVAALAEQDMMIVHCYAGTKDTAMFAERYSGCAIEVKSLGGDKTVDMPFDVTYGGTRTVGTAAIADGVATFTKATA